MLHTRYIQVTAFGAETAQVVEIILGADNNMGELHGDSHPIVNT